MHKTKENLNNINMKTWKFTILNDKEFANFAIKSSQNNFFESLYMKELLLKEKREVYLVGVKDKEEKILCATLLASSTKFLNKKTYEALKGYLIDYNNKDLLKFFTEEIEKFIISKDGFRLIIDPYIPLIQRDSDANIVENGIDNRKVVDYLKELGFKSLEHSAQVKWTYCLDINKKSSEEIFKQLKPNTRNYINRTINKYKLEIEELSYEKLNIFKKITSDTCDRRDFADRSLKYYEDMYEIFGDEIKVLISKLNCDKYLSSLKSDKQLLENKFNNLSDSHSHKKEKASISKELDNINNKLKEVEALKENIGNEIILSGAMFVLYGDEIVYLFSGSYEKYMKYCGQYALQWEMIKYACDHNYKRYNFYGIKDVFNPQGKDYGVYAFKKGFNGYVEELLGAYEKPIGITCKIYNMCKKIKNILSKGQ